MIGYTSGNTRRARRAIGALALTVLLPVVLHAQDERGHNEGFFLRLSAGGGGAATESDQSGTDYRFSGSAVDANIAIGGIVSPGLALHGTLFGWTISRPEIEVGGSAGAGNGDLTLGAIGAGLTYYFMPANIYLSGSLGLGRLEYKQANLDLTSSTGVAFDLTIGKEWWVGENWGLGAALGLGMHSVPDEGWPDNWSGGSVTLRFTATMN